jgi:hypothetical protein
MSRRTWCSSTSWLERHCRSSLAVEYRPWHTTSRTSVLLVAAGSFFLRANPHANLGALST